MSVALRFAGAAAVIFLARATPDWSLGGALAALLLCLALGLVAVRSRAAGPALVAMLAGLCFVATALINIPEAVLFSVVDVVAAPIALVRELGVSVLAGVAVAAAAGRLRAPPLPPDAGASPAGSVPGLLGRLAAAVGVFVVCYFAVGAIIYPWVRSYYETRSIPALSSIVAMQVLRAVALIAAMYPALQAIPSRRTAQWVFAVVLPVLGGLVPLLPENPLMPLGVRAAHAAEIVSYYTLFGFLVATWFSPRGQPATSSLGAPPVTSRVGGAA